MIALKFQLSHQSLPGTRFALVELRIVAMQKIKLIVRLPRNRDFAGQIHVEDSAGKRLVGPFPVCGRADDKLARENKNPRRDPLLPFGDTPLGEYHLSQIIGSGPGTPYAGEEFGSAGIILLQPKDGDAALADANGRFGFFIQGGALSRNGLLRPADGSLRLSNRDQRKLIGGLRQFDNAECHCVVLDAGVVKKGRPVAVTPARNLLAHSRAMLSGLAGTTALEPAHRSWLRQMLLAGRLTISIPSLLMLSSHAALSQHAPGSGGSHWSARQVSGSIPILFAADVHTALSHDYGGNVPGATLGQVIVDHAQQLENQWNAQHVTYQLIPDGQYPPGTPNISTNNTSDCNHFVHQVLQQSGLNISYVTAGGDGGAPIGASREYVEIPAAGIQPGDIIVQYPAGGDAQMGIYTRTEKGSDGKDCYLAVAMDKSGVRELPWSESGGVGTAVSAGGPIKFYRPAK